MLPYIYIGSVHLSTYWLMFAAGGVGILVLTLRRRGAYGFGITACVLFTLLTLALGFGGAKLLYIFENWESTLENGVTLGGVSFFGSVYLILLLMPLFGRLFRLKPLRALDCVAPCVAVMIGCIRVGCFFNGCCGGRATASGFILPTQAMESVCDFMLLYFLLEMEKKERFRGLLYPTLLASYSAYRFLIEFMRDTPRGALGLSNGHFFAIAGMVVGGVLLYVLRGRKQSGEKTSV